MVRCLKRPSCMGFRLPISNHKRDSWLRTLTEHTQLPRPRRSTAPYLFPSFLLLSLKSFQELPSSPFA